MTKRTFIPPLLQGCENEDRFDILISLTSIRSKPIIQALKHHYVAGRALEFTTVDAGNFTRAKKILNMVAHKIELIKEMDWVKHGNS